jgi:Rrf2 family nitric oxide-sensitive transcriptional repressor
VRVTLFTDYSLRVLLYLGIKQRKATVAEISKSFRISRNHLVKVVHFLSQKGYVKSYQGKGGGLELAINPADFKVGDFVLSLEPTDLLECFNPTTNTCPIQGVCRLERAFHDARKAFIASLNRFTLQDCLANGPQLEERMIRLGLTSNLRRRS